MHLGYLSLFLGVVGFTILMGVGIWRIVERSFAPAAPARAEDTPSCCDAGHSLNQLGDWAPAGIYFPALGESPNEPGQFVLNIMLGRPLTDDEVIDFLFVTFMEENQDPSDVDEFLNQITVDDYDARVLNFLFTKELFGAEVILGDDEDDGSEDDDEEE